MLQCGSIKNYNLGADALHVECKNAQLRISLVNGQSIRVQAIKTNQKFNTHSFAVHQKVENGAFILEDNENAILLHTEFLVIHILKSNARILFYNHKGILLNADDQSFPIVWVGDEVTNYKTLQADEKFTALGEKTGNIDKRGLQFTNWNTDQFGYNNESDPLYASIPFYMGITQGEAYGIFLDNTSKTTFNFGASNNRFSFFRAEQGQLDYYFFYSGDVKGIISQYTVLTGRAALPPLWSLGYQQCRYSYYPDKEILQLARQFRERDIPADVLYLDIHYMQDYKVFTWHNHRFPNPLQLHSDLAKEGFKSVVILDPGVKIEKGYKVYDEGVENELFVKYPDGSLYEGQVWPGWCHFPDFTLEKTRNWWANKIKDLADAGVSGFWNDMNEPAVWGKNFPDITRFDMDGNSASHKMAHNIYGMQMARSTAQGAAQHLPNKRPFVLTRAAFAGSQRYAAIWTGDNYSSSDHLLLGTLLVNNLGLSGYAFAGNDVGGFIGECSTNLFIRWIQVGAFTPLFRVHSMINSRSAEPWSFGEEAEEIARNYIKFRYAILPYIYTAFYEHSQSGMPISRSLLIDYYADKNIFKQEFQYEFLFGSALLICAVLPDKNLHKVYLPESMWYDFFTDTKFQGSKEHILELPMEKLPVFVKEGSFIPMQEPGNHTAHIVSDVLALHFYHCKHSTSYTYYEDEGDGFGYNQGVFVRYAISFSAEENAIHIAKIEGNYQSRFTRIKLYLHGFEKLGTIKVNGKIASINTSDFSFMAPISDFDPFSKRENNNMQIKNLPYIEFAFENQININVEK